MPGELSRQRAEYRRGLVLGFTVAELMLLILFALLLALGFVLLQRDREVRQLSAQIAGLREADLREKAKADVLGAMVDHKPTDEFFSELVRARELQQQLEAERSRLVERERAVDERASVLQSLKGAPDQKRRLLELAAIGARAEAALAQTSKAAQGARDAATLQGQVIALRAELKSVGHGGDYPPCWVTGAGQIEYLFDISLNASGTLGVGDIAPPSRLADQRALPIPPALMRGPVSRAQFLAMTKALLDLSNQKKCRFYVIVRDRTGPTQKDLFKTLLIDTVEARFYKVVRA